jgi:hypothetical protein
MPSVRLSPSMIASDLAHLPVVATVARLVWRELTLQNEYLRLENRTLKERVPGPLRSADEEHRSPVEAAPCPWAAHDFLDDTRCQPISAYAA